MKILLLLIIFIINVNTLDKFQYSQKFYKFDSIIFDNFTLCPFTLSNLTNISILASTTITTANLSIINNGNIALTP